MAGDREFGMGRGKVFPAEEATSLLNPLRRLVQAPRRTVRALGLSARDRVLEVGAGPGFFSPALAAAVGEGHLMVLDLQPEMVDLARERLSDCANVTYVQGDAASLPYATGGVDVVFLATMLGEVPNQDQCLGEVRRVLRRGGILAVSETRRDSDFVPLADLRERARRHSLDPTGTSGIRWQYVARFRAI